MFVHDEIASMELNYLNVPSYQTALLIDIKLEQFLIMVNRGSIILFSLFIPHVFSLKVLSFEKLNFVEERSNLSSFALKFKIEQVCRSTPLLKNLSV